MSDAPFIAIHVLGLEWVPEEDLPPKPKRGALERLWRALTLADAPAGITFAPRRAVWRRTLMRADAITSVCDGAPVTITDIHGKRFEVRESAEEIEAALAGAALSRTDRPEAE